MNVWKAAYILILFALSATEVVQAETDALRVNTDYLSRAKAVEALNSLLRPTSAPVVPLESATFGVNERSGAAAFAWEMTSSPGSMPLALSLVLSLGAYRAVRGFRQLNLSYWQELCVPTVLVHDAHGFQLHLVCVSTPSMGEPAHPGLATTIGANRSPIPLVRSRDIGRVRIPRGPPAAFL